LTNRSPSAPPFDVDDGWNDREEAPADNGPHRLGRPQFAPLERNEHAGVERERHAARRRRFFGASPRHSASMRSIASSSSGGMPYFSKNASAAARSEEH